MGLLRPVRLSMPMPSRMVDDALRGSVQVRRVTSCFTWTLIGIRTESLTRTEIRNVITSLIGTFDKRVTFNVPQSVPSKVIKGLLEIIQGFLLGMILRVLLRLGIA